MDKKLGIWLSTESHMQNRWRLFEISDKGSVIFSQKEFMFYGKDGRSTIQNIEEIDLTTANFPWGGFILSIFGICIFLTFIYYWQSPEEMMRLTFFLIVFLPIIVLQQKTWLWIKITYQDENSSRVVYISDRSGWGRIGLPDGTLSLYKELRSFYFGHAG
jgi:hypothetical protein